MATVIRIAPTRNPAINFFVEAFGRVSEGAELNGGEGGEWGSSNGKRSVSVATESRSNSSKPLITGLNKS